MFHDTDPRYTRSLENWGENARIRPARSARPIATVLSLLAAAAVAGSLFGGGAA